MSPFPPVHSSLTRCQELLPIDPLDLWAGLIPCFLDGPRNLLRVGYSSVEETRLNHSHLHPKVGELPPARQTGRGARTSEGSGTKHNKQTRYTPNLGLGWDKLKSSDRFQEQHPGGENNDVSLHKVCTCFPVLSTRVLASSHPTSSAVKHHLHAIFSYFPSHPIHLQTLPILPPVPCSLVCLLSSEEHLCLHLRSPTPRANLCPVASGFSGG